MTSACRINTVQRWLVDVSARHLLVVRRAMVIGVVCAKVVRTSRRGATAVCNVASHHDPTHLYWCCMSNGGWTRTVSYVSVGSSNRTQQLTYK